ncbi:MAG: helix-turn-helix domain-containing protein [Pseudobutyrivibrio sp.]|nr:helix-turn-helix domain-containing protein [Pseudobutyrivibrio sp.]
MDTIKVGNFLKVLRKEKGLTQEMLGAQIGVTNKTISRWENGNYLPPVECLKVLADFYDVSINEIISGQRLSIEQLPAEADNNLKEAIEISENNFKKNEKYLTIAMVISTLIAIAIIYLLPSKAIGSNISIALIILVAALALISNTVNLFALIYNKERFTINL